MKDRTTVILLAISIFIAGVAVGRMINIVSNNETNINVDPVSAPSEPAVAPSMPADEDDEDEDYEDDEDEDDD